MTEGDSLNLKLDSEPESIVVRQAYADWLDEQGDPIEASFQRDMIKFKRWPMRIGVTIPTRGSADPSRIAYVINTYSYYSPSNVFLSRAVCENMFRLNWCRMPVLNECCAIINDKLAGAVRAHPNLRPRPGGTYLIVHALEPHFQLEAWDEIGGRRDRLIVIDDHDVLNRSDFVKGVAYVERARRVGNDYSQDRLPQSLLDQTQYPNLWASVAADIVRRELGLPIPEQESDHVNL